MTEPVELDIRPEDFSLSEKNKKVVMRQLKKEFGGDVEISVDEREEGVIYNITLGVMTTVGTVVVTNPQMVAEVIRYIYESDHITIGDIASAGDGSYIEVNTGNVNINSNMINIERQIEIDESTTLVKTTSEEEAKELIQLQEEADEED